MKIVILRQKNVHMLVLQEDTSVFVRWVLKRMQVLVSVSKQQLWEITAVEAFVLKMLSVFSILIIKHIIANVNLTSLEMVSQLPFFILFVPFNFVGSTNCEKKITQFLKFLKFKCRKKTSRC